MLTKLNPEWFCEVCGFDWRWVQSAANALRAILEFDPETDTDEGMNEWGAEQAWWVARDLAAGALGVCPWWP